MVQKPLIKQGYSLAEEIANSVSHGIGLVFGIVGLVLLLVQAVDLNASATAITSYSLLWRQYDPAVPRFDALSRHSSSTGKKCG
ncbi:hemolysin (membrane protein) [Escherichia coli]|uniref:Hemolysin ( membrane protein) n=1 Tax=Escherichia coli TaxID=562 RepID=A0A376KPG1_ECOLX|nr:hemolysin (membrane protein) [Escherichia coli]STJ09587.1 hemolysin (membrane protein) [Escherichia coli]